MCASLGSTSSGRFATSRSLPGARPRRRYAHAGLTVALLGVAYSVIGFAGSNGYGVMLGPALVVAGVAPELARRWPGRRVTSVAAALVLVWAVVAIPVLGVMDVPIDIPIFLAQGLTMTAAAIALVTVHQEAIGRGIARLTGRGLSVRLGLAYPLARRFRTGMTLGMFSIVMLTLVYMSVISYMFQGQADSLTADLSGGFAVVATSNSSNPVTASQLSNLNGVDAVAPLSYVFADFTRGGREPMAWPVTGFGPEMLAAPPKLHDIGSYPTNAAAWTAVHDNPALIIVDDSFLLTAGGPSTRPAQIGDTITIRDPQSGQTRELTVAAKAQDDLVVNGAFVSATTLQDLSARELLQLGSSSRPRTPTPPSRPSVRTSFPTVPTPRLSPASSTRCSLRAAASSHSWSNSSGSGSSSRSPASASS